jgi:WD40 repeat protein
LSSLSHIIQLNFPLLLSCLISSHNQGRDKSVWIWELEGADDDDEQDLQCLAVLQEHTQDVKFVRWHPDRLLLASSSYDDTIRLWVEDEDDDWSCMQTLQGHSSTVWAVDFDTTGSHLVSVGDDASMKLWSSGANGVYQCTFTLPDLHSNTTIYTVSWSPHHGVIATGGADNGISLVKRNGGGSGGGDGQKLELVHVERDGHEADVNCVAWNPVAARSHLLASCSDDGAISLWQLAQ